MRKRVSITIRTDLLRQVDSLIDGVKVRNRSHALETLLDRVFGKSTPDVYLLAGDEHCLKRIGEYSAIEHTIRTLKKQGFVNIAVGIVSGSGGEDVRRVLGNGSRFGVQIRYLEQPEKQGTAQALRNASGHFTDAFLVIYGDNIFDFDLKDLVAQHKSSNRMGTLALTSVDSPRKYGVAKVKGQLVVGFDEKPGVANTYIISAGLFVFEPKIFEMVAKDASSIEKDVLPRLIALDKLGGYVLDGFWTSLDSKEGLKLAETELLKK